MKKALAIAGLVSLSVVIGTTSLSAARTARKFSPHQEPRGIGNLVARGDRVMFVYDAGVKSATGAVYVRNDLQRRFVRVPLVRERGPATTYRALVPARLIRGHRLLYYAVLRDRKSRRTARVPAAGRSSAWILDRPVTVRLGTHVFGQTHAPGTVVARARADQVGWQLSEPGQGPSFGPQSFAVGSDRSIWLHDSLNDRMLVWNAGAPDTIARTVPLPARTADNDVALGPAGSIYVTSGQGHGLGFRIVLSRLDSIGRPIWTSRLAGDFFGNAQSFVVGTNSSLRTGPDGTLHVLAAMAGLPGGEQGWMPVAAPGGTPYSRAEQLRRTHWPYQPVTGGLRLVSESYVPPDTDTAPHEARFALVDRRGNVARSWRVLSRTDLSMNPTTPELVGGDPVVVLDATAQSTSGFQWEYVVLRLSRTGASERFSLARTVFGDNLLADLRIGPDGALYQLASAPSFGVVISRYSLEGRR